MHGFQTETVHYQYQVVRLWEMSRADVIEQGLVGFYPLMPMMKGDTPPATVMQEALSHIVADVQDGALQQDLIAVLGIFGGEVYGPEVVRQFIRGEMLMQSEVYKEWIAEDIRKAEVALLRENILDVLTERFPVVRQPLRDKINAVGDVWVLKALHKWSVKASTLDEFEDHLNKIITA